MPDSYFIIIFVTKTSQQHSCVYFLTRSEVESAFLFPPFSTYPTLPALLTALLSHLPFF